MGGNRVQSSRRLCVSTSRRESRRGGAGGKRYSSQYDISSCKAGGMTISFSSPWLAKISPSPLVAGGNRSRNVGLSGQFSATRWVPTRSRSGGRSGGR
jgi:hypothetical protein